MERHFSILIANSCQEDWKLCGLKYVREVGGAP